MSNKLVKLGSLVGPKGDPGFTIIGEISTVPDLDIINSDLSTYKPKINDAWVLNPNYDDSTHNIEEKKGAVWVYRGKNYTYPEGSINYPPFEYVTNLRGPKGEIGQNTHFVATYNDFVTAKYYSETMKVGDAVIDNGEADFSRKGNMYKITDISEYIEAGNEDLYGKWVAVSDINQIKNNTPVIVVSNTPSNGSFCMHKKMDVNNLSNYLFLNPVNSYWNQSGALFYVYFFNNSNSTFMWKKMEVVDSAASTKIYYTEKEEGYPNCIFVRVNPSYTGTNYWDGKWNQTADLEVPTSNYNLYTITGWGNGTDVCPGKWVVYTSNVQKTTTILAKSIPVNTDINGNKYIEDSNIDELSVFYLRYLDSSPRQFSFYNSAYSNDASIYCNTSEAGLKIGTSDENNEFILDKSIESINGYFKNIDTGKWVGVRTDYNDWRGYTSEPNKAKNINGQSFDIFVYLTKDLYGPSNPKVTIDTNTVIELDPNKPNVYNAGTNISINDLTINATGYKYDSTTKSFAAGENINNATGNYSFAEGNATVATGNYSHAEGNQTISSGENSHSEGYKTTAQGVVSHAEGSGSIGIGVGSHAEGSNTIANGIFSHAEGESSIAFDIASHAEGSNTNAKGRYSHAEGDLSQAEGERSHAEGYSTITTNNAEHAEGRLNKSNNGNDLKDKTLSSIGIGESETTRKNAFEVMQNGDIYVYGLGDYDGTNPDTASTLQKCINENQSSQSFTLTPATTSSLGGIMVGNNLSVTGEGVLTAKGYSWDNETNTMTITSNSGILGKINAEGGFFETSDARKKDILGELSLDKAYDFIRNCEPILYYLKGSDKTQIGLIAQEVREFFPEIVNEDEEGYLSLDYAKLTVIILRVLKDLIDKK